MKPRGRPFIKGQKAWNENRSTCRCQYCGTLYKVPQCRLAITKYCSGLCHNRAIAEEIRRSGANLAERNPMWKGGVSIKYYRRLFRDLLPQFCTTCGSRRYLNVHHLDEDRTNNNLSNLRVLCRSCHSKLHGVIVNITGPALLASEESP
jgi:hypothetical protein